MLGHIAYFCHLVILLQTVISVIPSDGQTVLIWIENVGKMLSADKTNIQSIKQFSSSYIKCRINVFSFYRSPKHLGKNSNAWMYTEDWSKIQP